VAPPPVCRSSSHDAASRTLQLASLRASSFAALGSDLSTVRAALDGVRRGAGTLSGAVLFASGQLAEAPVRLLSTVRAELGPIPLVLAASSGVLTERGEHQGASAVSGVAWSGGSVTPIFLPREASAEMIGPGLAEQVRAAIGDAPGTVLLLAQPQAFSSHTLDELGQQVPRATVVGGGTLPAGAFIAAPFREPTMGAVVGLALGGMARPAVRAAPACRLLAPWAPITEARGSMVLRIGDEPALDKLTASSSGLGARSLVLAAIAEADATSSSSLAMLVRGIRGIDPARKGVVVTDEAREGLLMAFAVCDAATSRNRFAACVRDVERQLAGAAPQFGLLMTCAGRGVSLYGERDVDTRIVRQRFPHVPFAGMFSSFEIGPFEARPALHLYTGVLAVFGSPS
jgi:small ligand-binding sensory domain FIST